MIAFIAGLVGSGFELPTRYAGGDLRPAESEESA